MVPPLRSAPLRSTLGLALVLAFMPACDQRSDEELRSMMSEVASSQVSAVESKLGAANDDQTRRLETLEREVAELQGQLAGLEGQLAGAKAELEELGKAPPPKPTTPSMAGRPDPASTYRVELGDAQTIGPADALVTIVTFSDFQCPFCSRVSPTIAELRKSNGDDLRYAFKHNPLGFHKDARAAAIAAEAAGEQGKFWEMHDKLFENQRSLTESNFVAWARELGLNVKQFERDLASTAIADRVDRHQRQANDLGARGTPAFFINGRFLSGAQPRESFQRLIDEEKAKAAAKVATGTPRSGVYAAMIAGGKTEP
ncbi:DsbA family protein [Paraliomyxa miuraensis]|uniref:DsbA family protein n=1 Tax=Paraliomyxa miuraensis TaxID=376150 RepID=UPI00224C8B12|nr:DsbA family protein [Paraliomyxa miuraensis]MCX4241646.1 thioredoxin domain-containing protein [Paraliomyxa miuraensis]